MSLGALAGAGASLHLRVARPIPGCADIWQEIYYGKTERVRLSVACGQISPIDGDAKRSVLDYAITWYQYEIALMFLEESASTLSGSDVGKRSAIRARRELCFNEPHRDRGAYILQKVIALDDENAEDCWPIHEVVRCGGNLTEILEGSTEGIDALDNLGNAPLHWAVDEGDDTAIRTLITYGANPNIRDSDNRTPLMDAVRQPQLNCADALISGGCDVNASDHEGYNALYSALDSSKKGTAKMLSFLINHGAQLTDYYGGNMVHWLAQYPGTAEAEEKFRILILAGVDLIGKDDDGYTPLMRALRENNEVMLRLLLDAGCRFDATPTMDNALIDAASFANAGSMDILEETRFTVDVRVQDKDGDTPLDIFEWRMGTDHSELPGEYMPPPDDDVKAFGRLLQGVRDRYLTAEIETLETVIQHLKGQESTLAREVLQPVIQEKFYWNIPAEHRTFRAIDVQIKEAMMEAAIESLEEFVDVSRARIGTDPFEGSYCRKSGLRDKGLVVDAS
ncbi:ankyrin repeat-containing domain protein [Hypoxylon cercidicola]|nr:ankyrin repeat-containing domain protein [Hypoxylon cercidicola]